MSRTMRRNGSKVENAALDVALAGEGGNWLRFSVSQVAKRAGVSKPTVVKYLKILEAMGIVREEERDMRYCTKLTPKTYRWTGTLLQEAL